METGQTEQWGGRRREDRNLEQKQARRLYGVRESKLQAAVIGHRKNFRRSPSLSKRASLTLVVVKG